VIADAETREDALASRQNTNDIVVSPEKLWHSVPYHDILDRIGYINSWVLCENCLNELTNYANEVDVLAIA
jgi:hypothetical protein